MKTLFFSLSLFFSLLSYAQPIKGGGGVLRGPDVGETPTKVDKETIDEYKKEVKKYIRSIKSRERSCIRRDNSMIRDAKSLYAIYSGFYFMNFIKKTNHKCDEAHAYFKCLHNEENEKLRQQILRPKGLFLLIIMTDEGLTPEKAGEAYDFMNDLEKQCPKEVSCEVQGL